MDRRQHQAQNHQSGHHQTSYPYPPQQHGQYPQPMPNTYNDRAPSHHAHPPYPEGSLQHPPSGQRYDSHSPYAGNVLIPESHYGGSASQPQAYTTPSTPSQNLTVATHHQHERRGSHDYPLATGSSSDSQRLYPAGAGSNTDGGSSQLQTGVQLHHEGGYAETALQPQDWSSTAYTEGNDYRPKGPPYQVSSGFRHICRYPRCNNPVYLDNRVNEHREWCSDQHMMAAIAHGVEQGCKACGVWPRRNGFKYCSGNSCRNPYPQHYR